LVKPLKFKSVPAFEISVNEVFPKIITGQITTKIIRNSAGPIHGRALKNETLWLTLSFLVRLDLDALNVAVAKLIILKFHN
jgi:hypothetical protein